MNKPCICNLDCLCAGQAFSAKHLYDSCTRALERAPMKLDGTNAVFQTTYGLSVAQGFPAGRHQPFDGRQQEITATERRLKQRSLMETFGWHVADQIEDEIDNLAPRKYGASLVHSRRMGQTLHCLSNLAKTRQCGLIKM